MQSKPGVFWTGAAPSQCSAAAASHAVGSSASSDAAAAGAAAQDSKQMTPNSFYCEHKNRTGNAQQRSKCKVVPALNPPCFPFSACPCVQIAWQRTRALPARFPQRHCPPSHLFGWQDCKALNLGGSQLCEHDKQRAPMTKVDAPFLDQWRVVAKHPDNVVCS